MKVAYCIFGSKIHGAEKRVIKLSLCDNLIKNNHIDYLLVLNTQLLQSAKLDKELSVLIEKRKSNIHIIPDYNLPASILTFWYFLNLVIIKFTKKIDLFHTYLSAGNISMLLTVFKIKVFYEITSPDIADTFVVNYSKRKGFYYNLFKINCVSESVYKRIKEKITDKKVLERLCFISRPFISTKIISDQDFIKKENTIIYAARFIERKNAVLFAEVINRVLDVYPNWNVKILGTGPLKETIEKILENKIKEGKAYVGYTSDIIGEFKKSKVIASFIQPNNYPSQSIFEAMANGNAVIVSNTGTSSVFVGGNNGILSEDYESDLLKMLSDEGKISEMGKKSIDYFIQNFQEDKYFEELIKLYQ